MSRTKKRTQKKQTHEVELNQYIFTNNYSDARLPALIDLVYRGAFENSIGIMAAKDVSTEDGEDVILLVGVEVDENGTTNTYPIARVLDASETRKYRAPDGQGGYFDERA